MQNKYAVAVLALAATPVFAQLSSQAGFSGEIAFNTGVSRETSNLNTDNDPSLVGTDQAANSSDKTIVFPLGNVAYTFGQKLDKQVYVGTAREDVAVGQVAIEIAYKQELQSGTVVQASFLPTLIPEETWSNPYQLDSERTTTDEKGHAYRFQLKNIAGSQFSIDSAYAIKNLDNETTASELQRDSNAIYLKPSYRLFLSRTAFLVPSVTYIKNDAKGEAASYDQWGTELTYIQMFNKHSLALTLGYENRTHKTSSQLFDGVNRSDNTANVFLAYKYQQFLNLKDWSFISLAGYSKVTPTSRFMISHHISCRLV
ncbi:hypothetical protein JCM19240_2874 [Vibrio maritimus]|uniref:Uncharacterized protein n=1 Tax=Vibrio maritimus TaxID=990268 RepID=A0A090T9Z1_9VIBR|nr:hypothetical protein JCM19240_2874 [Vibrio maritimus]